MTTQPSAPSPFLFAWLRLAAHLAQLLRFILEKGAARMGTHDLQRLGAKLYRLEAQAIALIKPFAEAEPPAPPPAPAIKTRPKIRIQTIRLVPPRPSAPTLSLAAHLPLPGPRHSSDGEDRQPAAGPKSAPLSFSPGEQLIRRAAALQAALADPDHLAARIAARLKRMPPRAAALPGFEPARFQAAFRAMLAMHPAAEEADTEADPPLTDDS
jgi:hypothetical protein